MSNRSTNFSVHNMLYIYCTCTSVSHSTVAILPILCKMAISPRTVPAPKKSTITKSLRSMGTATSSPREEFVMVLGASTFGRAESDELFGMVGVKTCQVEDSDWLGTAVNELPAHLDQSWGDYENAIRDFPHLHQDLSCVIVCYLCNLVEFRYNIWLQSVQPGKIAEYMIWIWWW